MTAAERLTQALIELADRDKSTPCQRPRFRDRWISDDPDEREWAAHACRMCPVLRECAAAGDEYKATAGVWGGTDRTKPTRRKAA